MFSASASPQGVAPGSQRSSISPRTSLFQLEEHEKRNVEDLADDEKKMDPLLGISILMDFDGTWFKGLVRDIEVDCETKERLYRVQYEDGDEAPYQGTGHR